MSQGAGDKRAIRRRMLLLRDLIDDRLLRSVQLWADVAALDEYRRAATVMAFCGIAGEPDTDPLFARLAADGKALVLPRAAGAGLEAALPGDALVRGPHGVREPTGATVDADAVDLVLVPGVAFTTDGCRLGRGGGHYDRFLAGCTAPKIGVCFAEQLVDALPVEPHDVRVHRVVAA
ncbi:MAG: 5-formyltetrahydrofolate cyclo-ligase [Ilumatobacteraceae bacterium]